MKETLQKYIKDTFNSNNFEVNFATDFLATVTDKTGASLDLMCLEINLVKIYIDGEIYRTMYYREDLKAWQILSNDVESMIF